MTDVGSTPLRDDGQKRLLRHIPPAPMGVVGSHNQGHKKGRKSSPLHSVMKMTSAFALSMTSAVRRPSLKSLRAEDCPTWGISVSATMSCFTPFRARVCSQSRLHKGNSTDSHHSAQAFQCAVHSTSLNIMLLQWPKAATQDLQQQLTQKHKVIPCLSVVAMRILVPVPARLALAWVVKPLVRPNSGMRIQEGMRCTAAS